VVAELCAISANMLPARSKPVAADHITLPGRPRSKSTIVLAVVSTRKTRGQTSAPQRPDCDQTIRPPSHMPRLPLLRVTRSPKAVTPGKGRMAPKGLLTASLCWVSTTSLPLKVPSTLIQLKWLLSDITVKYAVLGTCAP
jgi:hypothetical protein